MNGPVTIFNGVQPNLDLTSPELRPGRDASFHKPGPCPTEAVRAGYGPERKVLSPDEYSSVPSFNLDDSPEVIGDERGFYGVRDNADIDGMWLFSSGVEEGRTYRLRIYIHNSARAQISALNTRLAVSLPSCTGRRIGTNAFISATNSSPGEVWGGVNLYSDRPFTIRYVPGSLTYCNNFYTCRSGPSDADLPEEELFTSKGVAVGYDTLNGVFPGGYTHSAYVSFLVEPIFDVN